MTPKLIIGLSSLQKEEWTALRKYILMHSREDSDKFQCFTLLQKHKAKFDTFELGIWHRKYWPQLSEKVITNIFSKLFGWYEEWMVYNSLKKDQLRSGIELVKLYNRGGDFKLADSKSKQMQVILDNNDKYNPEYDQLQYQLYYYQFFSDNPIKDKDKNLIVKLTESYLKCNNYNQSLLNVQLKYWNKIRPIDNDLFNSLASRLNPESKISLMDNLLHLLEFNDLDSFHFCRQYLLSEKVDPNSDLFTLMTLYLVHIVQSLWYQQKITDPTIMVDLFLFALNNNVFIKNGKISFRRFITIVRTIGPFKTFAWTTDFINKWISVVDIEDHINAKEFAMVNNYFQQKQHKLAALSLQKMSTKFVNSRSIIHQLALRVYYDTRDINYDLLLLSIDRFESFLKRRKTDYSSSNYKLETNFVKAVKLLTRGKLDSITFEELLPSKNPKWLLEKIKEANSN